MLFRSHPAMGPHLGRYVADQLGYEWSSADPRTDELQVRVAAVVERAAAVDQPLATTFAEVDALVRAAAGMEPRHTPIDADVAARAQSRPRLTEAWFCCAEPTEMQRRPLGER
mgnify:FL=1